MTNDESVPWFTPLNAKSEYAKLHKLLWPTGPSSPPADSELEPLARHIEACTADMSLWTDDWSGDATAMDVDKSEQPPPPIRYINLTEHRTLAAGGLLTTLGTLIVRQEYVDFMAHAMRVQGHFFVTGQPGIEPDLVFYFCEAGVYNTNSHFMDIDDVKIAVACSWVLIDVDTGNRNWIPPRWVNQAPCLVWTSSPTESRKHRFINQFDANTWYMKPWSLEEIAAVTTLEKRDRKDVRARFAMSGPVARSLFSKSNITTTSIDMVVFNKALADDLFHFATSVDYRMFLIQPQEVFDEAGRPSLQRKEYSFHFLSNYIASRTAELTEWHVEKVRRLAQDLDNHRTRSAAGKLVESMLHRALIHQKIDLPAAFGGGPVAGELELIGKAEELFLETQAPDRRDCRPLYLRPQWAPNFAAVDAILVTATVLCLFSSLDTTDSRVIKTILQILTRLETNKIAVDSLRLVYCVVGPDEDRVKRLVREASNTLTALQASPQPRDLRDLSQIALTRLGKLQVEGFTFDPEKGLVPLP
ncbi:hypothetical protein K438DRAFT_1817012 [Mycena galopus ATCC 62051]|nr:hypothetical protein K438DRAFT_1817012 [Mycena galopus ATCC 62051]